MNFDGRKLFKSNRWSGRDDYQFIVNCAALNGENRKDKCPKPENKCVQDGADFLC